MRFALVFIIVFFFLSDTSYSQNKKSVFGWFKSKDIANDTLKIKQLNDSTSLVVFNDSLRLLDISGKFHFWKKYDKVEMWKPSPDIEIWVMDKSHKIIFSSDSVLLWLQMPENEQLEKIRLKYNVFSNKSGFYSISPNLLISEIENKRQAWIVRQEVKKWRKKINHKFYKNTDTTVLWSVDSSSRMWNYKDSFVLWKRQKKPKQLKISNNTIIWTINKTTELWKNASEKRIWIYDPKKIEWKPNDSIPTISFDDSLKLWKLDKNIQLWTKNDSVDVYLPCENKIWQINDSLFCWLDNNIKSTESLFPKIEEKKRVVIKKSGLHFFSDEYFMWKIDDKNLMWRIHDKYELWTDYKVNNFWTINDSAFVWTINEKLRASMVADSVDAWHVNDSTHVWDKSIKPRKIVVNDTITTWKISKQYKLAKIGDSIAVWRVNQYLKWASNKSLNFYRQLRQNEYERQISDSVKISGIGKKQAVWRIDKKLKFSKIDTHTSFIRINKDTRIAVTNDTATIWNDKKAQKIKLSDSLRAINIDKHTRLWKTSDSVAIWRKDNDAKVWNINDTLVIWSYTQPEKPQKKTPVKYWKLGGIGSINFAQGYFENWAKGGENNISTLSVISLYANYEKDNTKISNNAEIHLGILKPGDKDWRKNEDKIELAHKFGKRAYNHWYYTLSAGAKSQIFKGYNYPNDSVPVSDFLSPLVVDYGIGLDFSPSEVISIYLSPITSKLTYVRDTAIVDQTKYGIETDKKKRHEPGFHLKAELKYDLTHDILLKSKVNLFSNYVDNPQNIDIDCQINIDMKINRYITSNVAIHMIYDDDIAVPIYKTIDGEKKKLSGPRLQFKELLSVGFSYKF